MTIVANGKLTISRIVSKYSEELLENAAKHNIVLPELPPALSLGATNDLSKFTSHLNGSWFAGFGNENKSNRDSRIDVNDAIGNEEDFEAKLTEVLALISEDACEAQGEFIITGADHGEVERWTVVGNKIAKERTSTVWPDGTVFRRIKREARW